MIAHSATRISRLAVIVLNPRSTQRLLEMSKGVVMDRIPVSGPWITQKEIDYVTDAVTNAWYSNANVLMDIYRY